MRAEDIVEELGRLLYGAGDATIAQVMTGYGIAYDEMTRALLIGSFRRSEIAGEEPGIEEATIAARLWMEGFLVGLRMAERTPS